MPTQNQKKQIIKELKETALEEAYHGKALKAAKEIFPLTENELETIFAQTKGPRIRVDQELEKDEPTHEPDSEPSGPGM